MRLIDHRKKLQQNPEYIAAEKELKPFLILAGNILRLRLEKGWSQTELAKRTGTKQANISRLEDGLSNPTLKFIARLAEAFDVTIAELMEEGSSTYQAKDSGTCFQTVQTFEYHGNKPQILPIWFVDFTSQTASTLERVKA